MEPIKFTREQAVDMLGKYMTAAGMERKGNMRIYKQLIDCPGLLTKALSAEMGRPVELLEPEQ